MASTVSAIVLRAGSAASRAPTRWAYASGSSVSVHGTRRWCHLAAAAAASGIAERPGVRAPATALRLDGRRPPPGRVLRVVALQPQPPEGVPLRARRLALAGGEPQ